MESAAMDHQAQMLRQGRGVSTEQDVDLDYIICRSDEETGRAAHVGGAAADGDAEASGAEAPDGGSTAQAGRRHPAARSRATRNVPEGKHHLPLE